jgi:hypothetical protein
MPVPQSLLDRFSDPIFWKIFFYEAAYSRHWEDYETAVPNATIELPVGGGYQVVLDLQGDVGCYQLGIRTPASDRVRRIGWDDQAHPTPFALWWSELILISRAVAKLDRLMWHPGLTLVLLCRFTSVQDDDDVDQIEFILDKAFESLRPAGWTGYWPNVDDWFSGKDFRGCGVTWTRDQSGNLYASQDLDSGRIRAWFHSMRYQPKDDPESFPHEEFRNLLLAASNTLGT